MFMFRNKVSHLLQTAVTLYEATPYLKRSCVTVGFEEDPID